MRHSGELEFLQELRLRAGQSPRGPLRLGIGDDCALLCLRPGEEFAVTTDLSIVGRHFRLDWHPPQAVGHRTLARGLSDLAAMGARPVAAFVSLGLPASLIARPDPKQTSWAGRFYDGLLALAQTHRCPLAGGDLAESPVALGDIVLTGAVPHGRALLRSGARPGDILYVTGFLGGAAVGLAALSALNRTSGSRPLPRKLTATLQPHLYPQPRIAQGLWLQGRAAATACLDISDGLSTDLNHICEESGVSAEVDQSALPIAPGGTLQQALHGGEDYELLFTARPGTRIPRRIAGVGVTPIGRITRPRTGQPIILLNGPNGAQPLQPQGWEHFA